MKASDMKLLSLPSCCIKDIHCYSHVSSKHLQGCLSQFWSSMVNALLCQLGSGMFTLLLKVTFFTSFVGDPFSSGLICFLVLWTRAVFTYREFKPTCIFTSQATYSPFSSQFPPSSPVTKPFNDNNDRGIMSIFCPKCIITQRVCHLFTNLGSSYHTLPSLTRHLFWPSKPSFSLYNSSTFKDTKLTGSMRWDITDPHVLWPWCMHVQGGNVALNRTLHVLIYLAFHRT